MLNRGNKFRETFQNSLEHKIKLRENLLPYGKCYTQQKRVLAGKKGHDTNLMYRKQWGRAKNINCFECFSGDNYFDSPPQLVQKYADIS